MLITVFTPTFNRAPLLQNVYDSLLIQKVNFEWLIVDDGSTDNTENIVSAFINERKINIRYYKKENGGKHTAINFGLEKAKGELFVLLDSDDILYDEQTLSKYTIYWERIKKKPSVAGILGLSSLEDKLLGTKFPKKIDFVSITDLYFKYKVKGDKAIAYKTKILKKYKFPKNGDVKFVLEAVVWHKIAKKYTMYCINDLLQKKIYIDGGLSNSDYESWYIKGLAFSNYQLIKQNVYPLLKYPKQRIVAHLYLIINSLLIEKPYYKKLQFFPHKIINFIIFPRAYFSYLNIKKLINAKKNNQ